MGVRRRVWEVISVDTDQKQLFFDFIPAGTAEEAMAIADERPWGEPYSAYAWRPTLSFYNRMYGRLSVRDAEKMWTEARENWKDIKD